MRIKWIALTFFLGFIVILDPTQMPAQDIGKGKGKGGDRGMFGGKGGGGIPGMGGGAFPGGGYGAVPGIAIMPAGGGYPGAGTFPMPNYAAGGMGNPGAFGGGGPGFGGGAPGGMPRGMGGPGGGMGGPGGGNNNANGFMRALNSPETAWMAIQQQSGGGDGDSIDLAKLSPPMRNWLKTVIDKTNAAQLPETGLLTRADFLAMYTQNAAINDAARTQRMMPGMGPDGFGPRNGMDGWDNGGNTDRQAKNQKKDKDPEETKPEAIRYGHLPKGLPEWFEEYDIDKDGQVALWEWRKAGDSIASFRDWDLNDDGVITADEVIRGEQIKAEAARNQVYTDGGKPPPSAKDGKGKGGQKPAVAADGEAPAKPPGTGGPNAWGQNKGPNALPTERPPGKGPRDGGAGKDNSSDSEKKPPEKGPKNRTTNNNE
jgi:hypothetical protein